MALKAVYSPPDELLANTVRDLLESAGIPALVRSFQIPAYDGIARMMRPTWGEVLVEEEDWERARELVEGFLASADTTGDGPPPQ